MHTSRLYIKTLAHVYIYIYKYGHGVEKGLGIVVSGGFCAGQQTGHGDHSRRVINGPTITNCTTTNAWSLDFLDPGSHRVPPSNHRDLESTMSLTSL